ncbi:recombination protein Rad52 [Mytilinidion resinicola]|uniref:RAD52 homolog n=1 Tax=Mytilinidion resinicola TaxID=574789 RepID=A0A6A6YKD1_9PEZI|nr:recombination protein Rad52 [Mytilinidion resinicola]KAF2809281.1 recombination protein Rad52 [Mytilinidion resinicola]
MIRPGDQYKSIANPFEDPRVSNFTAQEIATLQSRLSKQLGPEYVSTRPGAGGGRVAYLEAQKAINLANDVFGFNGWSSSIREVTIDFVDEVQATGRVNIGLSIIVRVTLKDGTFHEDIGYGHIENCKGKAPAFEKAKKEAATDGLKRALRTFGNVLGNCLYDKEYLVKVKGVKAAPSKWDPDNLHRHPDFAPIKREPPPPPSPEKAGTTARVPSLQSNLSSVDFEDEFGGNLFDGVDISEGGGDEFGLDAVSDSMFETPKADPREPPQRPPQQPPQQNGGPPQQNQTAHNLARQGMNRPNSMPALKPQNGVQQPPQNNQAQQPRPVLQAKGPQTPNGIPHAPAENGPPGPPINHEPPVGFITARAAEHINKPETSNGPLPKNLPAFNPHAESPSLRRTSGFDHMKSGPISRQAIVGANQAPANGANVAPVPRPNFINPQADTNRRIGMPGAAQSPLANRGAYKPPGPAVGAKRSAEPIGRPPLSDVSNKQAEGGPGDGGDFKRPRVEGTENQAVRN